jgi:tRNA uracil 4-sulfurtransferase
MRIFLESSAASEAAKRASRVFGVHSTSPAVRVPSALDGLTAYAVEYAGGVLGGGSFAVRARRSKDYPLESQMLERHLGAAIQGRYGSTVDLTSPDTTIGIEIHSDTAYVYSQTVPGVGGLPYGTQGALVGRAEDRLGALAAWMMMRRGCAMSLAGPGTYAEALSRFSRPDIEVHPSVGSALSAGAAGVVVPQTLDTLDFSLERGLKAPVYRPLVGLSGGQVDALLSLAGM